MFTKALCSVGDGVGQALPAAAVEVRSILYPRSHTKIRQTKCLATKSEMSCLGSEAWLLALPHRV